MALSLAARVRNLRSSPTLAVTSKANQLKAQGVDVVSFGAGEPDFDTPQHIKDAAVQALQKGLTKYTPTAGIPALKQAIVEKFKKENSLTYDPAQILVSSGAKHSLYNIFQVICDPGDEIIIPAPYWVSYPEMVELCGGFSVFLSTDERAGFKITPAQLRESFTAKTKALVLNSPSNPTGGVYTRAELEAIAALCVQQGIYIISDEIYEKLVYDGQEHVSIAAFNQHVYELTFTVNGLSKAYSMTGWRIGYLGGPKAAVEKMSNLQDHSTSCPNSIAQHAALAAFSGGDAFVQAMRQEYLKRRDYLVERLGAVAGLSPFTPRGAFYVFCNIMKTGLDSMTFAKRLLEEANVALIPGSAFGAEGYVRLSFATSMEQIKKGADRIAQWAGALKK
ncbi:MAG: pyridoxal phosphate-dependent aminotransferase [Candidatus Omnitrophica bacterium]|nr:pyridoxal phosphate-dependent aminotransferase [Candidatus Omnitrophota bacterium]